MITEFNATNQHSLLNNLHKIQFVDITVITQNIFKHCAVRLTIQMYSCLK